MTTIERKRTVFETEEEWLEARVRDITSTEVSALFGCNPWLTKFELWHQKKNGEVVRIKDNDRMKWGRRFQDPIAKGVAEDNGWNAQRWNQYISIPELRLGSSFDWRITGEHKSGFEIKNVDFLQVRDKWIIDGDYIEAPPHIEFQLQHQMLVSGYDLNRLAAMVGGNDVRLIERPADPAVHEAIIAEVSKFWASIDADEEPTPDFSADLETLKAIHAFAEPGKVLDASEDEIIKALLEDYDEARGEEKVAVKRKRDAQGHILSLIGDAERVITPRYTISAKMLGPTFVEAHERKGRRDFRVTKKKGK